MKAKRKIDQKAIQQFFIDHTEKFVIGLVGLLFVYFTYMAFTLDHYKNSTEDLKKATAAATVRMTTTTPTLREGPKSPVGVAPIPPYAEMVDTFKKPIDRDDPKYRFTVLPYFHPYAPPRLRGKPAVLVAEKLRAVPGRGPFTARAGGQNNGATVGQRWVVVTGLVPYRKQVEEYITQFKDSASEENMTPVYVGFLVQRGEVTAGGQPAWEHKVVLVNDKFFATQLSPWVGSASEIVDEEFVSPQFTSPLPPLASGEWGEEVAHLPEVKIAPPPAAPAGGNPGIGDVRGARPPGRTARTLPEVHDRVAVEPPPGAARGSGEDDASILGDKPPVDENNQNAGQAADKLSEYKLLRYFDFDVEAGKQYAYRAFVVLQNPNYKLPANVVMDPDFVNAYLLGIDSKTAKFNDKRELVWVDTDPHFEWSRPCVAPKLPGDMRLLAGPTTPAKVPQPQEVTGEARVLRWGGKSGLNQNYTSPDPCYRGTVLNWPTAEMKTPGMNARTKVRPLDTDSLLVDLTGGDPIVPRDRDRSIANLGPGAMIVLDESGNLVIHDEMGGYKEWTDNTREPEKSKTEPPLGPDRIRGGRTREAPSMSGDAPIDAPDGLDDARRRRMHGGH